MIALVRRLRHAASLAIAATALASPALRAQAIYAGIGPGAYLSLGGTVSAFNSDYGQRHLAGGTVYLDANLYRRIGVEAEFRRLSLHTDAGVRESTWLIGPRISTRGRSVRPFARLLFGRGQFNFPYSYAHGSYFVVAPGAGLDWRIAHSRVTLRVIDFEYQRWPGFTFGPLHPYGVSAGLSLRIFQPRDPER